MSKNIITSVVCTCNRYELVGNTIKSLVNQSLNSDEYTILVIDNSSTQKQNLIFNREETYSENIEYHYFKEIGLSASRNKAIELCKTPFIAFIDDDAEADELWLENLIECFNKFQQIPDVIGGKVLPIWESKIPSWLSDNLMGYLSILDLGSETKVIEKTEWIVGTNMAFHLDSFHDKIIFNLELGRTNNNSILLSNEEIEVINNVNKNGGIVVYEPLAIVHHRMDEERLNHNWFRRRVTWQAISDQIMQPELLKLKKVQYENVVTKFLEKRSHKMKYNPFFFNHSDPDEFKWQLSAIYAQTVLQIIN